MKQRFSSLDVKVIAHELSNALVSLRVGNIYDLSTKIFLIKFAKPDRKEQIVIDSGFRCHLTKFSRATAATPSPFVARLRKALKTRRVTAVSQIGTDRIIEFQFSEGTYKLFLEFYAAGNIILTDKDLNILALLRIVPPGEGQEEQRVGLVYSLENRQNYGGIPDLTKERLQNALQKAADREEDPQAVTRKGKKKPGDALRKGLAVSITEFPPMLVDHAMRVTGFDSTLQPGEVLKSESQIEHLMRSLQEAQRIIKEITSSEITKGYIIAKKKENYEEVSAEDFRKGVMYDDFHAFRPQQFENDPTSTFLEFEGFNKTVDEFFSSIEGQRLTSKLEERETHAKKKIESARQDQQKRLGGLQDIQELNERKASTLQVNADRVQETTDAVNGLIAQGKDWVEIGMVIELEQKRGNPVAAIIKLPLKLEENTITLLLDEEEDGVEDDESAYATESEASDSEDEAPKNEVKGKPVDRRLKIDIDLALSPWANAREYFGERREAKEKEKKTLQSSTMALKSQEAKIAESLKKGLKQEKAVLRPVRTILWVEKFTWFISSDGYLVLAGKDSQQNETLYKSYLKKGDIYVHADLQGAATVVIRNNPRTPDAPIPPSTLQQAGVLAVSCSTAWDSKAGMSAWWVNASQVSKQAPTGDYLPTGTFSIRGQKNFLPPATLLLGFGVLFQISEESKARHMKHRVQDDGAKSITPTMNVQSESTKVVDIGSADSDSEAEEGNASDEDEEPVINNLLQTQAEESQEEPEEVVPTQEIERLEIKEPVKSAADEAQDSDGENSDSELESVAPTTTGTQTPSLEKGPAPPKRGKKGKAKKLAQKYKDQDEDDRIAAQQLLGSAGGQKKADEAAAAKEARDAEIAFQKERRKAQHQRTQKETAEHEEIRKAMLESGETAEEEAAQLLMLEALVGQPLRGDEILEAIPVCAPYAAMGKYKYKVKLQPGTVKKGKAVRDIVNKWVSNMNHKGWIDEDSADPERMWPREVELLKAWKVEEITNVIPVGKVRVVVSGGMGGTVSEKKGGAGRGRAGKGGKKR